MNKNRVKKYLAVILSLLLAFGSLGVHGMTVVQAEDKSFELGGTVNMELPIGGQNQTLIHFVDDSEAWKVPSLELGRSMVRSTTEETIFEKGTGDYGYKSLTAGQQALYGRIAEALTAFENGTANVEYTQIVLSDGSKSYVPFSVKFDDLNINKDDASQAWIAFMADRPWIFWLENGCAVTSTDLMPIVRKSYWGSDSDANALQKRTDIKNKIEKEVKDLKRLIEVYYQLTYDRVREMDEMIISKVDFAYQQDTDIAEEADMAHTVEGVFAGEHNAVVSEGYAKAFSFLLNIFNIPNVYVTGNVNVNGSEVFHAWNCVSFDNGETYYYMDLAWDDTGAVNNFTGNSYQYFAMPKSKFEQKHTANTSDGKDGDWLYDLPELGDDTYYTYFMQFGAYGTSEELTSEADILEFFTRVRELRPSRLSTCAMKLDNDMLKEVDKIIEGEINYIPSEEDNMYIWSNPLESYSNGSPNATFSLETKNLTIDLGSETEKTLKIENIVQGNGNYIRWCSDSNDIAVVKIPFCTKMEKGIGVSIIAKKAGTAVIHANVSKGGTMTCKVEVTGQRPVSSSTPKPTVEPTSTPSQSQSASVSPVVSTKPDISIPPEASEKPNVSSLPSVSGKPDVSVPPETSEKPNVSLLPSVSGKPDVSVPPETSEKPNVSLPPSVSGKPDVSVPPEASERPDVSTPPEASEKPDVSESPVASKTPSVSGSPVLSPTQGPNSGIVTNSPSPTKTSKPTLPPSTKAKKVKVGSLYKSQKNGAEYKVTGTGKNRTVTYQRSTRKSARKVTVPSVITVQGKRYKVTGIASQAFAENKKMREVSIGKNVKSIGKRAFKGCKKLKKVKLGKNVTTIQDGAFRGCTSLTLVIIPKKVKTIGNNAFRDCKRLKYIGVETNRLTLKNVGKNAFLGGYGKPRVKTDEKMWKKYAYIFFLRGLSNKGLFVIDPVDLVI